MTEGDAIKHLDAEAIMRVADEIMSFHDVRSETRQGRFARMYPEFVEAYPRLFAMCCLATTPSEKANVRQMLTFLLQQRAQAQALARPLEQDDAPMIAVHAALRERYVSPALAKAEEERLRREAEAEAGSGAG